jgi:hypothetical protein
MNSTQSTVYCSSATHQPFVLDFQQPNTDRTVSECCVCVLCTALECYLSCPLHSQDCQTKYLKTDTQMYVETSAGRPAGYCSCYSKSPGRNYAEFLPPSSHPSNATQNPHVHKVVELCQSVDALQFLMCQTKCTMSRHSMLRSQCTT